MPINTRAKRESALQVLRNWNAILPVPDSDIQAADRAQVLAIYSGIAILLRAGAFLLNEVDIWNRALGRIGESLIILTPITVASRKLITNISAENPPRVSSTAHGFVTGDRVLIRGENDATVADVNGRVFEIIKIDDNSYDLFEEDRSTRSSGGSGNGYAVKLDDTKAIRTCFHAWSMIRDEVFRAHAWNGMTKRGRLSRLGSAKTITGATNATEAVITVAAHGYSLGDTVLIEAVGGMTEINDRYYTIKSIETNTFELVGEDSSGYEAYSSGGTVKKALTPLKPDSDYEARYTLPADALRMLSLIDDSHDEEPWTVERDEVFCDITPTVPIRYIMNNRLQPEVFEALLVSALAARLSVEIVEELTQSGPKKDRLREQYEELMSLATGKDSQEDSPKEYTEDPWILSRA